jgi:hypothetical protein
MRVTSWLPMKVTGANTSLWARWRSSAHASSHMLPSLSELQMAL